MKKMGLKETKSFSLSEYIVELGFDLDSLARKSVLLISMLICLSVCNLHISLDRLSFSSGNNF